jgi:ABC-2 type transport system ATP-binding protein
MVLQEAVAYIRGERIMDEEKNNEIVLSVKNVSKNFHLPHEKTHSIKSSIINIFKQKDKDVDVQHALKDISFDIKKGEFFGILGRNGSGKSTMLKILAEIYQPTSGSVQHFGKLVPFIELGVGFNPELTGRENVYLNGALLGFSRKEIDARYDEIVEFAELEEFMDQKLKNYSSGMQVRLAFSVATRADADILLVDEVLAVGDADFQRKCYDFFKSLKESGKTVIFVTHDMGAVREYCDEAILISDGLIAHQGSAETIADEYLKLFNQNSDDSDVNIQEDRWGNGRVKIDRISADIIGDDIKISVDLKTNTKAVSDIVFGFNFKDSENQIIAGANTLNVEGAQKFSMDAESTKALTFIMPNILGSGTFTIGATVRLSDKITICDTWNNATKFKNTKDESHYPVIVPAKLEIK